MAERQFLNGIQDARGDEQRRYAGGGMTGNPMTGRMIGNYRVISKLGEGGMGKVYRAVDTMVEREVALKSLKPEIAARFSIQLELVDSKTGTSLWNGSYSHDTPVTGKTVADVVEALDRNVHDGLGQLTVQIGEYFASHPPQSAGAQ